MKIAVADNNSRKFTDDLIKHWESLGHEVKFELGASEHLAQWADVYYVDTWDNNLMYLYDLYHGNPRGVDLSGFDVNKKPKIVVRVLDWEVWCGFVKNQDMVDWVDDIIFIAPHIQQKVALDVDLKGKDVLIRPGVNLDKFPLKTRKTDGFQVGMVLGSLWYLKNPIAGLDIFSTLVLRGTRPWKLHIRGQFENSEYDVAMFEHYFKSRGIEDRVKIYPYMDDLNDFYENIDYLLHPSLKEAFCYAVAEAMAKGVRPIVNNFMGAQDIWDRDILYNTHAEAIMLMNHSYKGVVRDKYRKEIEKKYSLEKMLREYDLLFKKYEIKA